MTINPIASSILVIWYLALSLILVGAIIALTLALTRLNRQLTELNAKIDPLLSKADTLLSTTADQLQSIGDSTESIVAQGDNIVGVIEERTAQTASFVQKTVHQPFIGLNALIAGIGSGMLTFVQRSTTRSHTKSILSPPKDNS